MENMKIDELRKNGVYFTPPNLAEFDVEELIDGTETTG